MTNIWALPRYLLFSVGVVRTRSRRRLLPITRLLPQPPCEHTSTLAGCRSLLCFVNLLESAWWWGNLTLTALPEA